MHPLVLDSLSNLPLSGLSLCRSALGRCSSCVCCTFNAVPFRVLGANVSGSGLSYGCGRLAGVQADADARSVLRSLTGQEISTVTGRPNRILRLDGDDVIVATERSPAGTAVPIQMIQSGLDRLQEAGELEISVTSLGHRSSFVGAVLLTLPGTHLSRTSPPRILLADPATQYKLNQAGSINAWWSAAARRLQQGDLEARDHGGRTARRRHLPRPAAYVRQHSPRRRCPDLGSFPLARP